MNYNQAIANVERGKRVRRGKTLIYGQSPVIYCEADTPWLPSKEDMKAQDWELVPEVPAKVTK